MFKTKTIKAILEPVTQQIENLLLIGDYVQRGNEIPNLADNILKIVQATSQLLQVLNKIIAHSTDQVFRNEVKNSTQNFCDNIEKLTLCASLFKSDHCSEEAAQMLNAGSNNILNEVMLVLSSYDDVQVRKIDNHLSETLSILSKPLIFEYEAICHLSVSLQPHIVNSIKLLTARVGEIISTTISQRVENSTKELKDLTENLINSLNDVIVCKDTPDTLIINTNKVCLVKNQMIRVVIDLRILIWLRDLEEGEIELFFKTLPLQYEMSLNWLEKVMKEKCTDSSGSYSIQHILKQFNKFQLQKNIIDNDFRTKINDATHDFDAINRSIHSNQSPQESHVNNFINHFNLLKTIFINWYNNWLSSGMNRIKSSELFTMNINSSGDFKDYITTARMLTQASKNLSEFLASDSQHCQQIQSLISQINDILANNALESDFSNQGPISQSLTEKLNQLSQSMNKAICDKNIKTILDTHQIIDNLKNSIQNIFSCVNPSDQLLTDCQENFNILSSNLEDFNKISLVSINASPMPLDDVLNIEKSLEYINYVKDSLKPSISSFLQDSKNEPFKNQLDILIEQLHPPVDYVQNKLLLIFPHQNIIKSVKSEYDRNLSIVKSPEIKPQLVQNSANKMIACMKLTHDQIKTEMVLNSQTDKNEQLADFFENSSKHHTQLNKTFQSYAQNPLEKNKLLKDADEGQSFINNYLSFLEPQKVVESLVPMPQETQLEQQVPEEYKHTISVISNPESDNRIALAASDLHKQINKQAYGLGEKELPKVALEVSYMFANMSILFKDVSKHAEMIDTAKNIAKRTETIVKLAKAVLSRCKDRRLQQILSCAIDKLPTISQQLKIMSTLRASRLKAAANHPNESSKEANEMLIDCAENLMRCIKDVVKAADSADITNRPHIHPIAVSDL